MEQGQVQRQEGDHSDFLCSFRWGGHPFTTSSLSSKGHLPVWPLFHVWTDMGMGSSRRSSLNSPSLCHSEPKHLDFWFVYDFKDKDLSSLTRVRVGPTEHISLFVQRSVSSPNEEKDRNLQELVLQNESKVGVRGAQLCCTDPPSFPGQGCSLDRTGQGGSVQFRDSFCRHWVSNGDSFVWRAVDRLLFCFLRNSW